MTLLPKIFASLRHTLPKSFMPDAVYVCTADGVGMSSSEMEAKTCEAFQTITDHPIWAEPFPFKATWIEVKVVGISVLFEKLDQQFYEAHVFKREGYIQSYLLSGQKFEYAMIKFDGDFWMGPDGEAVLQVLRWAILTTAADLRLGVLEARDPSVNTQTRNQVRLLTRDQNGFTFSRCRDLASIAGQAEARGYTPPEEPSGIKKREHYVREHTRTYKSGITTTVRGHRRGDPTLGTTTRIITT